MNRSMVLAELKEILSSSHFKHSRRYPAFLLYVVEQTLKGASDQLKERTLGIAVFGRDPDYDTSPEIRLPPEAAAAVDVPAVASTRTSRTHGCVPHKNLPGGTLHTRLDFRRISLDPDRRKAVFLKAE